MTPTDPPADGSAGVLTGQVPVSGDVPVSRNCPNHKVVAHASDGTRRWCNGCGRDDKGDLVAHPTGGWGTPHV